MDDKERNYLTSFEDTKIMRESKEEDKSYYEKMNEKKPYLCHYPSGDRIQFLSQAYVDWYIKNKCIKNLPAPEPVYIIEQQECDEEFKKELAIINEENLKTYRAHKDEINDDYNLKFLYCETTLTGKYGTKYEYYFYKVTDELVKNYKTKTEQEILEEKNRAIEEERKKEQLRLEESEKLKQELEPLFNEILKSNLIK